MPILAKEYELGIQLVPAGAILDIRDDANGGYAIGFPEYSERFTTTVSWRELAMAVARTIHKDLFRVFLLTLVSLFAIPAATLVFTEYALRSQDAEFLQAIEARIAADTRLDGGSTIGWDEVKNLTFQDNAFADMLIVTHHDKGMLGARTTKVKVGGLGKQKDNFKGAVGRYWQRHQIMRAEQAASTRAEEEVPA
ncbi:hypothetical protein [Variovorax sp. DXTD-1]|uniref:hypothetical protein n=1 Tax=Variovorax sp. DXTD-1 TaxID=2495592 RepID=UPI0021AF1B91|nr:hypothetical protein [Variovorax sp. DXTD-1]